VPRTADRQRPWEALAAAALIVAVVGAGMVFGLGRGLGAGQGQAEPTSAPAFSSSPPPTPAPTPIPLGTSVAAGPCAPRPAGLTASWPGDNGREVVGGRDLQLRGNASFAPGLVGGALTLDGVSGYAEVPRDPALDLGTGDFTIMLWVRFAAVSREQVLIEQWRDPTDTLPAAGWTFTKLEDQVLLFTGESAGAGQGASTPSIDLLPGVWYHLAARRSGRDMLVFVNGSPIGGGTADAAIDFTFDTALLFGRRGNDAGFLLDGQLDEVRLVVGRALFQTDIQAIYEAGSTGACTS